jgi:hypothetical protein
MVFLLQLLGWQWFILNVPVTVGDTPNVAQVYTLRWRIEIISKAWKSPFNLTELLSAQTFLMIEAPVPEIIQRLCAYEKRRKRKHFLEKPSALS